MSMKTKLSDNLTSVEFLTCVTSIVHRLLTSSGMTSSPIILAMNSSRLASESVAREYSSSALLSMARVVMPPVEQ